MSNSLFQKTMIAAGSAANVTAAQEEASTPVQSVFSADYNEDALSAWQEEPYLN